MTTVTQSSTREPLHVVASTSDDDGLVGFQYYWPVRVHKRQIDNGDSMVLNVSPPFTTALNGVAFTWALRLCDECVVAAPGENGATSLRQVFLMLYYKEGPAPEIFIENVKMTIHDHNSGLELLSFPLTVDAADLNKGMGCPMTLDPESQNSFTTFIHTHIDQFLEIRCDFKLKSSLFKPLSYLPSVDTACRSQRIEKAVNQFIEDLSTGKLRVPDVEEDDLNDRFAVHRRAFMFGCDHVEYECLREGRVGDEDELLKHVRSTLAHKYFNGVLLQGVHYFEDFVSLVEGVLEAKLPPLKRECERFICREIMASTSFQETADSTFIKKMLLLSEKFNLDHLKMVTAGVLVDKMLCDSEKPMEDLGDMRDELKQIASEISTSCENLTDDAAEDDLVESVVDDLQTLAQRMRRVSLSHSPSIVGGSSSSSPGSSTSVTPTNSAAHSPAALDSPRPFSPSSPSSSRFKRVELDNLDDWYVYPPAPVALLRTH
ncbi:hypothetical protein PENTCL1PPCAC_23194 [Pristionchus entomophagus]|uniref:BTB domain-containing protein n=1 Tax=Pristionchus entomophagus TaxID=358040 RepID=A0AAV5U429_9BILA|nr:hypothetical protein PENTCL1PPCAC_23194 [Pristionchus entomophagus]